MWAAPYHSPSRYAVVQNMQRVYGIVTRLCLESCSLGKPSSWWVARGGRDDPEGKGRGLMCIRCVGSFLPNPCSFPSLPRPRTVTPPLPLPNSVQLPLRRSAILTPLNYPSQVPHNKITWSGLQPLLVSASRSHVRSLHGVNPNELRYTPVFMDP